MRTINSKIMEEVTAGLRLNKSLQKRLNLSSFRAMSELEWQHYEAIGLPTKDGSAGILFIESKSKLYAIPYEIGAIGDKATARAKSVICDFCKTWQAGGRAGSITFRTERRSLNLIGFLCCLDLKCSLHVRNMTAAAKSSRAQLREDVSQERRIERLEHKLAMLVDRLNLKPIINNTDGMSKWVRE